MLRPIMLIDPFNRPRPAGVALWIALVAAVSLGEVGCRLTSDVDYASPSYAEQNQAVLDIVPYGTTRKQAVETLKQQGVQGAFGVSETVYYCDVWKRDGGQHWHLDVALFFDQSGRLYKVGPSRPDGAEVQSALQDDPAASGAAKPAGGSNSSRLPRARTGPRTPFADAAGLE